MPVRPSPLVPPALVLSTSERERGDGKGYDKPPLSIKGRGGGAGGERGAAARGANPHTCGANPHTKRREEPIKAPARRGSLRRSPGQGGNGTRRRGDQRGSPSDRSRISPPRSNAAEYGRCRFAVGSVGGRRGGAIGVLFPRSTRHGSPRERSKEKKERRSSLSVDHLVAGSAGGRREGAIGAFFAPFDPERHPRERAEEKKEEKERRSARSREGGKPSANPRKRPAASARSRKAKGGEPIGADRAGTQYRRRLSPPPSSGRCLSVLSLVLQSSRSPFRSPF